jgi:glycosyltransferase involved in cell wall biosynthesis
VGLGNLVNSVAAQELVLKEFEHIIIDGCSTDGRRAFISKRRISGLLGRTEDKEIYIRPMNKSAESFQNYLLFLNSGDHLHSNSLEKISSLGNHEQFTLKSNVVSLQNLH